MAILGLCGAGLVGPRQPASAASAVGGVQGCFRSASGLIVTNVNVYLDYWNGTTSVPVFVTQPNSTNGCATINWDSSLVGSTVRMRTHGCNAQVGNTYSGTSPWVRAGSGMYSYGTIRVSCFGPCLYA